MAASSPTKTDDFTPHVAATTADDFTPFSESGSVMAPPQTTGQRLKRIGKTAAEFGVGTALPLAAGAAAGVMAGPEAAEPVAAGARIAGQAVGGAVAPYAESTLAKVFGDNAPMPSVKDALKSAAWNAAFAGLGEGGAAATKWAAAEDAVRAEVAKLPQAERTVGKIKQIRQALSERAAKETGAAAAISSQDLRNRDFWKAQGLSDEQIDEAVKTPDLEAAKDRSIAEADKAKATYQTIKDTAGADFKSRYNTLLGPHAEASVDMLPFGKQLEEWGQGASQHELTPSFRGFLQRKGLELTRAGEATGPSVGGVPWKQLPEALKDKLRAQGAASGIKIPGQDFSIQDIRDLRTELREQLPAQPTGLDTKAYRQLKQQLDTLQDETLTKSGATPEQIGGVHALDQEWGRFAETMRKVDPRSAKFGQQAADMMFDPMAKNPGIAMNLISLAQKAESVNPGVMGNLKEAFLNKAMAEARVPGEPMQEMKLLRKLQNQWGGDKESRAVMGAMFGKESPLADPATFSRVVEATSNPEPLVLKARQTWGRNILSSPYMQGMALFGLGAAASGIKGGGLWGAMTGQKGPEAQVLAIASLLAGPPLVGWAIRSGNSPLQRAMVSYLTNPSAANAVSYAAKIAGAASNPSISAIPTVSPAPTAP